MRRRPVLNAFTPIVRGSKCAAVVVVRRVSFSVLGEPSTAMIAGPLFAALKNLHAGYKLVLLRGCRATRDLGEELYLSSWSNALVRVVREQITAIWLV
jgi:hypothetical protein